jgi:hypothetical protein
MFSLDHNIKNNDFSQLLLGCDIKGKSVYLLLRTILSLNGLSKIIEDISTIEF